MADEAADDNVLRTDLVLENSRWLVRATAPDGSVHIIHSREEWEALRARYSASEQPKQEQEEQQGED